MRTRNMPHSVRMMVLTSIIYIFYDAVNYALADDHLVLRGARADEQKPLD